MSKHAVIDRPAEPAPSMKLFFSLIAIFFVIGMGFVAMRMGIATPSKGHTKAMGFYVGRVALPLLVFKIVALADVASMEISVLLACNVGKMFVFGIAWGATFCMYDIARSKGKRVLTATVFAFGVIASNDFALGFPVVEALYGKDMSIYIAGNAVAGTLIFMPLVVVLCSWGNSLGDGIDSRGSKEVHACHQGALVLRDVLSNPIIMCTIAGAAYRFVFGWTLVLTPTGFALPHPLSDMVTAATSAFGTCALLQTGFALTSVNVELWPVLLTLLKVVVCAFASFLAAKLLIPESAPHTSTLEGFCFFYGSIPVSTAPLVMAAEFDPASEVIMATCALLGLWLAGPIMYVTAVFLEDAHVNRTDSVGSFFLGMDVLSALCGFGLLVMSTLLWKEWRLAGHCPSKVLLGWYAIVALAYELVALLGNPSLDPAHCEAYVHLSWDWWSFSIAWSQNACRLLLLCLQFLETGACASKTFMRGHLYALACVALALVPSSIFGPHTLNEMCHRKLQDESDPVRKAFIWSCILLAATVALQVAMLCLKMPTSQVDGAGYDQVAHDTRAEASEPSDIEGVLRSLKWFQFPPSRLVNRLLICQAVRFLTQVVNCSSVLDDEHVAGSFTMMLLIEAFLERGQLFILVMSLLFDRDFNEYFSAALVRAGNAWVPDVNGFDLGLRLKDAAEQG